jgi:hypothetical protein
MNPVHTVPPYIPKINSNIIIPSTPLSSKWPLRFRFSNNNILCVSYLHFCIQSNQNEIRYFSSSKPFESIFMLYCNPKDDMAILDSRRIPSFQKKSNRTVWFHYGHLHERMLIGYPWYLQCFFLDFSLNFSLFIILLRVRFCVSSVFWVDILMSFSQLLDLWACTYLALCDKNTSCSFFR